MSADGVGVVAHAGSVGLRLLADRTGLTSELSKAMARRSFTPLHDRGRVLIDVAVMLADGGEAIADIDVLRHQSGVLGPVASPPTVWRALDEVTPGRLNKIATARARVRRHVWAQLPFGVPASRVAGTGLGATVLLDVDVTSVIAHSEKEQAAPTFKRTFGFHPLGVWCDNTSVFLAAKLRTGRAGSNTATDHIEVFDRCDRPGPRHPPQGSADPSRWRRSLARLAELATDQDKVRGRKLEYSVGFAVTEKIRDAIKLVPKSIWTPATDADGGVDEGGDVAELTGLLDLAHRDARHRPS
ncbi:transposase [Nocardioides daedukensis]